MADRIDVLRKSSITILIFLLIAFGGMLLAADVMVLRPVKKDLAVAKELKAMLGPDGRDWIVPDSRIRLQTCRGKGEHRMAQDGTTGVAVELEPKRKTLLAKGRAQFLISFVADRIRDRVSADTAVAWVEVIFRIGERFPYKTLIRWDARAGTWFAPEPAIPGVFKDSDLPPVSPFAAPDGGADG